MTNVGSVFISLRPASGLMLLVLSMCKYLDPFQRVAPRLVGYRLSCLPLLEFLVIHPCYKQVFHKVSLEIWNKKYHIFKVGKHLVLCIKID